MQQRNLKKPNEFELDTIADADTFDETSFGFDADDEMDALARANRKPNTNLQKQVLATTKKNSSIVVSNSKSLKTEIRSLALEDELGIGDFNDLFYWLKEDEEVRPYLKETGRICFKEDENYTQFDLSYFILEKEVLFQFDTPTPRRLVFMNLIKDADSKTNEEGLTSLSLILNGILKGDKVLKPNQEEFSEFNAGIEFLKREKAKQSIFILPVRQCRGFLRNVNPFTGNPIFKAAHIVLGIFDCAQNRLEFHDSQGGFAWTNPFTKQVSTFSFASLFYPDKANEIPNINYSGVSHHNTQVDDHMCGYFVHNWITLIAKTKLLNSLKFVRLHPIDIQSKEYYKANWVEITRNNIKQTQLRKDDADRVVFVSQALTNMPSNVHGIVAEYARTLKP